MKNNVLFILHLSPPIHGASKVGDIILHSKLLNKSFKTKYIDLSLSKNLKEIGTTNIKKVARYFFLIFNLIKIILIFKPKLIYITLNSSGFGFYKDFLIVFITKLFKKKVVFHFHNKGIKNRSHLFFDNILYKKIFFNSSVILLSPFLYNDIDKYISLKHVYFCSNGVDDCNSRIIFNDIDVNSKHIVNILFLSNLYYSKGILILLQSCSILNNNKIPFHCTIAGNEGDLNWLTLNEIITNLNLNNHVTYIGAKYSDDKNIEFNKADIFVLPTLEDCFPLVILEAMQNYLPVISTLEGGIPDIIDDGLTGFIIPKNNSLVLAKKLELLILNIDFRLNMGIAGRRKFENEFTISHFENKLTNIFNHIIESSEPF